jgi:hypothetical protein
MKDSSCKEMQQIFAPFLNYYNEKELPAAFWLRNVWERGQLEDLGGL